MGNPMGKGKELRMYARRSLKKIENRVGTPRHLPAAWIWLGMIGCLFPARAYAKPAQGQTTRPSQPVHLQVFMKDFVHWLGASRSTRPVSADLVPGRHLRGSDHRSLRCPSRIYRLRGETGLLVASAPAGAREVLAHLSDGRIARMSFDPFRNQWFARVSRPSQWQHQTFVSVRYPDGGKAWQRARLPIHDTTDFLVAAPSAAVPGRAIRIEVDPLQPVRAVRVLVEGLGIEPQRLQLSADGLWYRGRIEVPAVFPRDGLTLRIGVDRISGKAVWHRLALPGALPETCARSAAAMTARAATRG